MENTTQTRTTARRHGNIGFSTRVANDAGLLREYTAQHYGATLTYGGSGESMRRALRLVKRLQRMTGNSQATVLADLREDYSAIEDDGAELPQAARKMWS